eukprot:9581714-Karenia_brevis.AAC.1
MSTGTHPSGVGTLLPSGRFDGAGGGGINLAFLFGVGGIDIGKGLWAELVLRNVKGLGRELLLRSVKELGSEGRSA